MSDLDSNEIALRRERKRILALQPDRAAALAKLTKAWRERNPHKAKEYLRRFRAKFPEKTKARNKLHRAVKSGAIVRPNACEDCGLVSGSLHGHHEDYAEPLDVAWLCRKCHERRHGRGLDYVRERTA